MALAWHCDYLECNTWQKVDTSIPLFIEVREHTPDSISTMHFCCWDCLLKFSAGIKPMRVV